MKVNKSLRERFIVHELKEYMRKFDGDFLTSRLNLQMMTGFNTALVTRVAKKHNII